MLQTAPDANTSSQPKHLDAAAIFILSIFGIRLILAAVLGLSDDEAYYWDWSRHLSLSYYDHPGLTAWMIRLSTSIMGPSPFAVRFPGLLFHTFAFLLFWQLARTFFDERSAKLAGAVYLLVPFYGPGALLMTPDAPMAFFWLLTLWLTWKVAKSSSVFWTQWGWILLGLSIGIGFLAKYTILLLIPCGLLFLAHEQVKYWRSPWFWGAILTASICSAPVLIWNWQMDWPTVKFHLVERQSGGFSFFRWTRFILSQFFLVTPFLFVGALATIGIAWKRRHQALWSFILYMSAPVLGLFTVQALLADYKPHWPAPAYVLPLMGLVALWQQNQNFAKVRARKIISLIFWVSAITANGVLYTESVFPFVPKLARAFGLPWASKWDPTNDFYGWEELGSALRDMKLQLPDHPRLASWRYQSVAQIGFATGEEVWRLSSTNDEYRFIQNLRHLAHRSVLFVIDAHHPSDPPTQFESCEKARTMKVFRFGEPANEFEIWHCLNFEPDLDAAPTLSTVKTEPAPTHHPKKEDTPTPSHNQTPIDPLS